MQISQNHMRELHPHFVMKSGDYEMLHAARQLCCRVALNISK